MKLTGKPQCEIFLDARYDLWQAAKPNSDRNVAAFEAGYEMAARAFSRATGTVVSVYHGNANLVNNAHIHGGEAENEVWQQIHDLLEKREGRWRLRSDILRIVRSARTQWQDTVRDAGEGQV